MHFNSVQDATAFLTDLPRTLPSHEQFVLRFEFCTEKDTLPSVKRIADWNCCCCHFNTKRLQVCANCGTNAEIGAYMNAFFNDGSRDTSPYPTDTLLLLGIDVFMHENRLWQTVKSVTSQASNVYVAKDKVSKQSLGFAFVLFFSETAASEFMQAHCALFAAEDASRTTTLFGEDVQPIRVAYAQPLSQLLLDYWDASALLVAADADADRELRECLLFYRELERDATSGQISEAAAVSVQKAPVERPFHTPFVVRRSAAGLRWVADLDVFYDVRTETLFVHDPATRLFVGVAKQALKA